MRAMNNPIVGWDKKIEFFTTTIKTTMNPTLKARIFAQIAEDQQRALNSAEKTPEETPEKTAETAEWITYLDKRPIVCLCKGIRPSARMVNKCKDCIKQECPNCNEVVSPRGHIC
jgi:hypothetical protein